MASFKEQDFLYVTRRDYNRYIDRVDFKSPEERFPWDWYLYRGTMLIALDGTPPQYKGGGNKKMEKEEERFYNFLGGRE